MDESINCSLITAFDIVDKNYSSYMMNKYPKGYAWLDDDKNSIACYSTISETLTLFLHSEWYHYENIISLL
jgi:hypothetical protein